MNKAVISPLFDAQFHELATVWNSHQDLRRNGAGVAALATSRRALDDARFRIRGIAIAS